MTFIYFVLILGITVFVHELGHFIFAKKSGIYCYEFSLGMGPKLWKFKRKNDETEYNIKLFPIGGSVRMAGEEIEEDKEIPVEKRMQSKTFLQRLLVMIAGASFNFLLGILLLFIIGIFYGSPITKPYIGDVDKKYNAYKSGIREGDLILKVDGKKVNSWDSVLLLFELKKDGKATAFEIKHENGSISNITVSPKKSTIAGKTNYYYGISMTSKKEYGFLAAAKYSIDKFASTIVTMFKVIGDLFTGNLGIKSLAGPVGIYNLVGQEAKIGFDNLIYLVAFLSINVGFVNLLPFPAFDGGRALFLIIEKIRRKPINSRIENTIHTIGFALLMLLMVIITIQDVKNIIK